LDNFKNWLEKELEGRNWSYRELERRAGKNASNSLISLVLAGERAITWDFCMAIAGPLGYSPEEVFRIAGLLPENGAKEEKS
jgi:transcriptional regulator with XRE-family HTH domain